MRVAGTWQSGHGTEAVIAAGIRWVGPPPDAIRAMGDKAAARRLAAELGIPVVPGYDGAAQDELLAAIGGTDAPVPETRYGVFRM